MPYLHFHYRVQPKAVQSVRSTSSMIHYQPKAVVDWKAMIASMTNEQLPADHRIIEGVPIEIEVKYKFPPIKALKAADRKILAAGGEIPKITKPDITDNLMKGLMDAMRKVVWADDSLVWHVKDTKKVYSLTPGIDFSIYW